MRLRNWAVLGGLLAVTVATAQERGLQMGLKMSDAGYAVAHDVTIPMADMQKAGERFGKGLGDLTAMAEAEGLTLLGPFRIVLKNMGPTAEGTMPFQLQLPIIDQPTDEDLQADYGFEIVVLDAVEVAYTFHKGSMDQLQAPFMALMNWVPENGKQIAGLPCMIVYSVPENEEPSIVELQVPVQ